MGTQLDLNKKTAEEAARALFAFLQAKVRRSRRTFEACELPELLSPEEAKAHGYCDGWYVVWSGGPTEWATNLSLGFSMYADERANASEPEVLLQDAEAWYTESYDGMDLGFLSTDLE